MPAITTTTPSGGQSSSMLSSHADSPMSQVCTSFVYHHNAEDRPNHLLDFNDASLADLEFNKSKELIDPCAKSLSNENCSFEINPSNQRVIETPHMDSKMKPALVHTVSTYRKQQQQLRLGGTPSKVLVVLIYYILICLRL